MKTKAIAVTTLPEKFKEDLKVYQSITFEQIDNIAEYLSKLRDPKDILIEEQVRFEISQKANLPMEKIYSLFGTLEYTASLLSQYNDSLENFIDDLVTLDIISDKAIDKLKTGYEKLSEKSKAIYADTAADLYNSVLRVYRRCVTRCLLLPSFEKEFTAKDNPESYSTRVSSLFPGIALEVTTDGPGGRRYNYFVITESDFDRFINVLRLAKKQLDIFKSTLKKE